MSKIKPLFMFAIAITGAFMISADCLAQGCTSCAQGASVYVDGTCGSAGCDGGCQPGGRNVGNQQLKAKINHTRSNCAQVMARNQAWPMPFGCADRQLYFTMWDAMIDQGFEEQCVLSSAHFDPETGELNRFGKTSVADIMQNMPSSRREVFVHREADEQSNNARLAAVRDTIQTYYGNMGPARVSFSSKLPVTLRGTKAEAISITLYENQPAPIIPIATGGSVSSAVGN